MTPEERQMITDLANRIAQTPPPSRDPEAEELIRTKIGSRADACLLSWPLPMPRPGSSARYIRPPDGTGNGI